MCDGIGQPAHIERLVDDVAIRIGFAGEVEPMVAVVVLLLAVTKRVFEFPVPR